MSPPGDRRINLTGSRDLTPDSKDSLARYTGPQSGITSIRRPIFGPTQHSNRITLPASTARPERAQAIGIRSSAPGEAKVKFYGILERQFAKIFDRASRRTGITGENLLQLMETRLDNVVYRLEYRPDPSDRSPVGRTLHHHRQQR